MRTFLLQFNNARLERFPVEQCHKGAKPKECAAQPWPTRACNTYRCNSEKSMYVQYWKYWNEKMIEWKKQQADEAIQASRYEAEHRGRDRRGRRTSQGYSSAGYSDDDDVRFGNPMGLVNPSSGLPMMDSGVLDVGGNVFGSGGGFSDF